MKIIISSLFLIANLLYNNTLGAMERAARTVANPTLVRELKNGGHATEQIIFNTEQNAHILLRKPKGKVAFLELLQHVCNPAASISETSQELLATHHLLDQNKNPIQEQRDILLSMIKLRDRELVIQGATKL